MADEESILFGDLVLALDEEFLHGLHAVGASEICAVDVLGRWVVAIGIVFTFAVLQVLLQMFFKCINSFLQVLNLILNLHCRLKNISK